jgi:transglutaminase-like putative cysteine protease
VNEILSELTVDDVESCLQPSDFIDSDHESVIAFAAEAAGEAVDARQKAVNIYYAIRDSIRYDPYRIDFTPEEFRASACIARGYGFCITKAVLLAACCRAQGIPARLGFGDVKNHLATERLIEFNGGDIFYFHGYAELYLDGKWVKATPAFNIELCDKFGVLPLEFDGVADSVFHPHDKEGRRHMEYVRYHGAFVDLPWQRLYDTFLEHCPKLVGQQGPGGDFYQEAAVEHGGA